MNFSFLKKNPFTEEYAVVLMFDGRYRAEIQYKFFGLKYSTRFIHSGGKTYVLIPPERFHAKHQAENVIREYIGVRELKQKKKKFKEEVTKFVKK